MMGNVWQWTDEYVDEHTRAAVLRGGSYYRPSGSMWYFPQNTRLDQHKKLLLMAPCKDRAGDARFPLRGGSLRGAERYVNGYGLIDNDETKRRVPMRNRVWFALTVLLFAAAPAGTGRSPAESAGRHDQSLGHGRVSRPALCDQAVLFLRPRVDQAGRTRRPGSPTTTAATTSASKSATAARST